MILLREVRRELLWSDIVNNDNALGQGRFGHMQEGTIVKCLRYGQYRPGQRPVSKPFIMITFANPKIYLLCNDIVYKKLGGRG